MFTETSKGDSKSPRTCVRGSHHHPRPEDGGDRAVSRPWRGLLYGEHCLKGELATHVQHESQGKKQPNFAVLRVPLTARPSCELGREESQLTSIWASLLGHRTDRR